LNVKKLAFYIRTHIVCSYESVKSRYSRVYQIYRKAAKFFRLKPVIVLSFERPWDTLHSLKLL
jgi:predicted metallopeptidase